MRWAKLRLMRAHLFFGVWRVIGVSHSEEPIKLQSLRVPRTLDFLTNLKVGLLFRYLLNLNFLLYLDRIILKDLTSKNCFHWNDLHYQSMHDLKHLVRYIKIFIFLAIILKEKANKISRENLRGHCLLQKLWNLPVCECWLIAQLINSLILAACQSICNYSCQPSCK